MRLNLPAGLRKNSKNNKSRFVMNREDLKLYLVTDRGLLHKSHSLEEMVLEAVAGGVTMVQLREKIYVHVNSLNWACA